MRIKNLLGILLLFLCMTSCEKENPFCESQEGKNTLGFLLDGKKIEYATSGGFPSEYPYEYMVYGSYYNKELEISAMLENKIIHKITLTLLEENIIIGKRYEFDGKSCTVTLSYYPIENNNEYDNEYKEYQATAKNGYLKFTKWDPVNHIASGIFEFESNFTDPKFNGQTKKITNGMFDVSLQFREEE